MSRFNKKKEANLSAGMLAGTFTPAVGNYSNEELMRRVTMANLLFKENYYQGSDDIMAQMEDLSSKVSGEFLVDLAREVRFEQKLRHTPLWLLLLAKQYHNTPIKEALVDICTRPDMLMDYLSLKKERLGAFKPIDKDEHKGLARAFNNYDPYQLAKYKKTRLDISLKDVVRLVHPRPNDINKKALSALMTDLLKPADTWESNLAAGGDKKKVFTRLIEEGKLGAMATLRNLRNMDEAGVDRHLIKKALANINSKWLTPLDFLKAARVAPKYIPGIEAAMIRVFSLDSLRIPGTTVLCIDVSGSMGGTKPIGTGTQDVSRLDLAFMLATIGRYIFEDYILVMTAGSDITHTGKHIVWPSTSGFSLFSDYQSIVLKIGGGGIFTHQLGEWLKTEGIAKDADRWVVVSDSQDIERSWGSKKLPDTSPYKSSYILDISTHTYGIKTDNWTAEINGWTDKLFHYINALEKGFQGKNKTNPGPKGNGSV